MTELNLNNVYVFLKKTLTEREDEAKDKQLSIDNFQVELDMIYSDIESLSEAVSALEEVQ